MNPVRHLLMFAALMFAASTQAQLLGSGFTYQGELRVSNAPANGQYDLQFELFDSASSGALIGTPVLVENVPVSNGVFSVELDFGFAAFNGDQLWLELGVREGSSSGGFQGLAPRQKITAAPYALHAVNAEMVSSVPDHDHTGEYWTGSEDLWLLELVHQGTGAEAGGGLRASSASGFATINGTNAPSNGTGVGVFGASNGTGAGVEAYSRLGPGLKAETFSSSNIIEAIVYSGGSSLMRFRVASNGNVFANGSFTGGGADVAEFIEHHGTLERGDVVGISEDGKYERVSEAGSSAVAGVVTTQPGLLMNAAEGRQTLDDAPAMALAGRVPVKATNEGGPIRPGDLLIASSTDGHAMRAPQEPRAGTVIGKALGRLDDARGMVEMLVMLR